MIMSERGSFCTEYVYCGKCFDACRKVLLGDVKYLNSQEIKELPIIAGKLGGSWAGVEFFDMEHEYIPAIQELMCDDCSLRICVHSECCGSVIYEFTKYSEKITEHKPHN
jgi:hypothetical protein